VGAGIGAATGGALSLLKVNEFGYQLVARTVMGGIVGGVVSRIYGGNFWEGFAQGAATAAAAFLFNDTMSRYKMINQSANRQFWIDTQTGQQVPTIGAKPDDTFKQLALDQKNVEAVAEFLLKLEHELGGAAPLPTTGIGTFLFNLYYGVKGLWNQYVGPAIDKVINAVEGSNKK